MWWLMIFSVVYVRLRRFLPTATSRSVTSSPTRWRKLERTEQSQWRYFLHTFSVSAQFQTSAVRIFRISNRIVTAVFDSKRAQLFEIRILTVTNFKYDSVCMQSLQKELKSGRTGTTSGMINHLKKHSDD